jgi:hypothetical protein
VTSIPNPDGKTTEVDLTANQSTVSTTLVEMGVGAEKTPAEIEIEKRRARAAKFGIPFAEPAVPSANAPPSSKSGKDKKKPASEAAPAIAKAAPATKAAPTAEEEEALAKRRAKWGVVEKPGAIQKVKGKLTEKTQAISTDNKKGEAAKPSMT